MHNLKIIGIGCKRSLALRANVLAAVEDTPFAVEVNEVSDVDEVIQYNISGTPALLLDEKIVVQNDVPSVSKIQQLLEQHLSNQVASKWVRRILVPVDFSETAENAFQFAQSVAEIFQAKIEVLYVRQPDFDPNYPHGMLLELPGMELPYYQQLDQFIRQHPLHLHETKTETLHTGVKTVVKTGFAAEVILEYAVSGQFDLIVIGKTGESGWREKLFGSIAAQVSREAHCPVLMVPHHGQFTGWGKILYASHHIREDQKVLPWLYETVKEQNGQLYIAHVKGTRANHAHPLTLDTAAALLGETGHLSFVSLENESVVSALNDYAVNKGIQMIALVTKHRTFWQEWSHKSITRAMSLHLNLPVLVLHSHDAG